MSESEIKVGDRFLVEVEVRDVPRGDITANISIGGHYDGYPIRQSVLLAGKRIEPALKVGDKVRFKSPNCHDSWTRTILAVDGEEAWIKHYDGIKYRGRITVRLSDLERVP